MDCKVTALLKGSLSSAQSSSSLYPPQQAERSLDMLIPEASAETAPTTPQLRSKCVTRRKKLMPSPHVAVADAQAELERAPSAEIEASPPVSEAELPAEPAAPVSLEATKPIARSRTAPDSSLSEVMGSIAKINGLARQQTMPSPYVAVAEEDGGTYPVAGLVSQRIREHQRFIEERRRAMSVLTPR